MGEVDIKESVQQKECYITQNFSLRRTCMYIQAHDKESIPDKGMSYKIYYVRRKKLL